jgi:circadian clock protein KaiC
MTTGRTRTGIAELDEMLRGGFLQGDAVMVAGSAGTGKTTLALEYLVNGITRFGERGVYVTFEQLPAQIYRDAENLGWDLRKLEDQDKFRMVCTSPSLMLETDGEEHVLTEPIREIQPQRLVVDSLSHLEMYVDGRQLRKELYRLIMLLKARQLSSLLTWEVSQANDRPISISDVGTSFLVDCVLLLKQVEIESAVRKAMVILKMRGSDHDKRLREFEVTPKGVRVSGPFAGYEGLITGSPRRVASERFAELFSKAGKH